MTQIDEWESKGRLIDDIYRVRVHKPCGTEIWVQIGFQAICPKCEPDKWAEQAKKVVR